MTAVHTPGSPGATRRGKLAALFGGITAALLIIGCVFLIPNLGSADDNGGKLTCDNAATIAVDLQAEASHPTVDFPDTAAGAREKAAYVTDHETRAQDAINFIINHCGDDEEATPTTVPPSGGDPGECDGVKYRSYDVKGVQPGAVVRFGNQPVDVAGPGDANKVLEVLDKQLSHEAFKAAVLTQGNYLVDGGITVDQVQATATRFQQNPNQWRDSNRVIREKLNRAQSVTLEQTDMPYNTQDAVLGANRCVAPAAQNTTSSGKKWVLVIHLSQQDGGRTVRLVVNCDFQIQEFNSTAPPATTVPEQTTGTTSPPTATTAPPTTAPPTTAPPTTAPPTTAPPTTAPPPGKGPEIPECEKYPTMPGC